MRLVEVEDGEHIVIIELNDAQGEPIGSVLIALTTLEMNRLENRYTVGMLMPGYGASGTVGPFSVRVGLIS